MAEDNARTRSDAGVVSESSPLIVELGSAVKLTGKQPRGHKADGGAAGGDYKDGSESPHE
jgi:hypothetical protein